VRPSTLARRACELLRSSGQTVGVAESCTGGLLCARLTEVAGASAWFAGGVVAYSNEMKASLLDVDERLLASAGAVSTEVARAMARGARRVTGSDIGIGMTGIAGPAAEGSEKSPGLLYVALLAGVCRPGERAAVERVWVRHRDRGRGANRSDAVAIALAGIAAYLAGELPGGLTTVTLG
jgi:nicotinamide-nucleotide amidase